MDTRSKYQSFLIQYHAGVARDLPAISPFARDLTRQSSARTPSPEQLLRAFETDPFLAAKLTGASNSVFFAHDHFAILTVKEALRRVGPRYAMNLVSQAPSLPLGVTEIDVAPFWAHCMTVAHVAKSIAASARHAPFEPDAAHLVAMIHDLGYLLQLSYSPNTWPDIEARLLSEECGTDNEPHSMQGEELAKFWCLPAAAVDAIRAHHDPARCTDARDRWLSGVIAASEVLLQRTWEPARFDAEDSMAAVPFNELGVSVERLARLHQEAWAIWDECMLLARRGAHVRRAPCLKLIQNGRES